MIYIATNPPGLGLGFLSDHLKESVGFPHVETISLQRGLPEEVGVTSGSQAVGVHEMLAMVGNVDQSAFFFFQSRFPSLASCHRWLEM